MKRLTILHVVQCAGGVDSYLRMLLSHMNRLQFRHILICSADYQQEAYSSLVDEFVQVDMRNALSPCSDIKAIISVRHIVKRFRPDVVYCHSSKGGGIGRLACIGLGVPVMYNPHGWAFSMRGSKVKSLIYLCLEKMLAPFTDQYVVISYYEQMAAVQRRVADVKKMKVIYNGIDIQSASRQLAAPTVTRQSLGIPENAYLICMAGRISAQKAPDVFVRMAAHVRQELPESYFMIVGDGDDHVEIERMIDEYGLSDCFLITGWKESPVPYIALADQAVLLSRWEGFGLVLAEYMLLGKPIVATEVNAIPELVVNHENGILVPCDDDRRAAEAVIEIYKDKNMRDKFIHNGKMRLHALFDIRRVGMEHEDLIANVCKMGK